MRKPFQGLCVANLRQMFPEPTAAWHACAARPCNQPDSPDVSQTANRLPNVLLRQGPSTDRLPCTAATNPPCPGMSRSGRRLAPSLLYHQDIWPLLLLLTVARVPSPMVQMNPSIFVVLLGAFFNVGHGLLQTDANTRHGLLDGKVQTYQPPWTETSQRTSIKSLRSLNETTYTPRVQTRFRAPSKAVSRSAATPDSGNGRVRPAKDTAGRYGYFAFPTTIERLLLTLE